LNVNNNTFFAFFSAGAPAFYFYGKCKMLMPSNSGAMGIMLVYDITNEKSFENIKNWIRCQFNEIPFSDEKFLDKLLS
jgi:GTPase SAR1 family protein